jgi:hypothetical protein
MYSNVFWFENEFGFNETKENIAKFAIYDGNKFHCPNGEYSVGTFEQRFYDSFNYDHNWNCDSIESKINFINEDIMVLQADPEFNHATFQIASNFNCLESKGRLQKPSDGIQMYVYDKTQGPAASISCGASTLVRNYFLPSVNLLSKTPIRVINGYPIMLDNDSEEIMNYNWDDLTNYSIGVGKDFEVITDGKRIIRPNSQFVNQAFCSELSFGYEVSNTEFHHKISANIMRANTAMTIAAAIEMHSDKCVLSPCGLGSFANKCENVAKGIKDAIHILGNANITIYLNRADDALKRQILN